MLDWQTNGHINGTCLQPLATIVCQRCNVTVYQACANDMDLECVMCPHGWLASSASHLVTTGVRHMNS